jgi:hypothetical protein
MWIIWTPLHGGTNSIFNCVLACGPCNGDERRETDWRRFIAGKASARELRERRTRIRAWIKQAPTPSASAPALRAKAEAIIASEILHFERTVRKLRALRDGT